MLFLHKVLPLFVLPLGWVVLLMVVGVVIRRRWPVVASVVILYLTSLPLVGDALMNRLESFYPFTDLSNVPRNDAIVVLGGILGPLPASGQSVNLNEANERLEVGLQLMLREKGHWLIFTGGRVPWVKQEKSEGEYLRTIAIARGIPSDKVLVTEEVGNTADEAKVIAAWMRKRGWKKMTLITSAWHMPRAARQFQWAGVDFLPVTVDFQVSKNKTLTLLDFLPSTSGLRLTEMVLREWYGIAYYSLRGKA